MERAQLRELLPELRDELQTARAQMQSAAAEVEALEKTIAGLEFLVGGQAQPTLPLDLPAPTSQANGAAKDLSDDAPRGKEAVRRILRDSGRPMKAQAVVAEIAKHGWINPDAKNPGAAIRVAIRRLADDGEVEKVGTGIYRYRQPAEEGAERTEA